jgi:secreted trypsin-like serine protease
LHPDWNSQSRDFDADISILVLREPVEFSRNVESICLPRQSDEDEVVGIGTVVGWGKSERSEAAGEQYDSTPNELEVPAVNNSHCFLAVKKFDTISSFRTFCAGYINESKSVCSGDGGGGFYLFDSMTKRFNLQGIVSATKYDHYRNRNCDINIYTIYTNVAKFIDWIRSEMNKWKEIKWEEVEFDCKPLIAG